MDHDPRALLRALFAAAVAAADPALVVPPALPPEPRGRTIVVGAGKASAAMARALEDNWRGPLEGLVITRYGHSVPCGRIRIVEAAHPTPDAAGCHATREMLALLDGAGPDDLVIALISGGGSALMVSPPPGVSLADKQAINAALLASGAAIADMNVVRRHLSLVKGGRLAARAAPARVVALLISDVPGDDPAVIASGPTVADASTRQDARAVLKRFDIAAPDAIEAWLLDPASESIKPGDPRLAGVETRLIATPSLSLLAAADAARAHGIEPFILGDAIEGEAAEVGKALAGMARYAARGGRALETPFRRPCVLLSGGETTVSLRSALDSDARGGRNVEFLLSFTLALGGEPGVYALAADTDGVDGAAEIAGAVSAPDTLARAAALGMNASESLARHDGHGFFSALGDSVVTGPTLTNVNDFRAILIL